MNKHNWLQNGSVTVPQLLVDLLYFLAFAVLPRNQACDAGDGFDTLCGRAWPDPLNCAIRGYERLRWGHIDEIETQPDSGCCQCHYG